VTRHKIRISMKRSGETRGGEGEGESWRSPKTSGATSTSSQLSKRGGDREDKYKKNPDTVEAESKGGVPGGLTKSMAGLRVKKKKGGVLEPWREKGNQRRSGEERLAPPGEGPQKTTRRVNKKGNRQNQSNLEGDKA